MNFRVRGGDGPQPPAVPIGPRERRCSRELFPMPAVQVQQFSGQSLSRKCRQRINREIHFEEEVNKTIDGLNLMHGAAKQRALSTGH